MARARIGKLFHLTPLVDSLADAEYFFNAAFSPLCMMRNYSDALAPPRGDLRHRRDVDRADALPPRSRAPKRPAGTATPRSSARACTTWRSTSTTSTTSAQRLEAAGVRITDAGSGNTVFCHPKDTPGMLEFHPAERPLGGLDPRFRPEWPAFRDAYWGRTTRSACSASRTSPSSSTTSPRPRSSTSTCSTRCRSPTRTRPSPAAALAHVLVGEDTILELLAPGDTDSVAAPRPGPGRARRSPGSRSPCATCRQAANCLELSRGVRRRGHRPRDPLRRGQDVGL